MKFILKFIYFLDGLNSLITEKQTKMDPIVHFLLISYRLDIKKSLHFRERVKYQNPYKFVLEGAKLG